jgi:hypothetical protein
MDEGFQWGEAIQDYLWRRRKQSSEVRAGMFSRWEVPLIFQESKPHFHSFL